MDAEGHSKESLPWLLFKVSAANNDNQTNIVLDVFFF